MDYPAPGDQATRDDDDLNDDSMETSSPLPVDLTGESTEMGTDADTACSTAGTDDDDEVILIDAEDQGEEMKEIAAGKLTMRVDVEAEVDNEVIIIEDSEESMEQEQEVSKDGDEKEEDEVEKADDVNEDENVSQADQSGEPIKRNKINVGQPTDIVQDLNARLVRWFYRDVKDDKKWTFFSGYDSLQIEWKYREIHFHGTKTSENVEMIIVRGGLYEVDVVSRQCFPIYWQADAVDVMRGTWFYDNTTQPVEENLAEEIEKAHLQKFRGQNRHDPPETLNMKGNKPIFHHLKLKGCHIDWNTITEVFLYSDTTRSKLARSIGTSIGLSKASSSGTKLNRGYCIEACLDDKPPPISHLVFVVHGIGQKMDSSSIIKSCSDLRASAIRMINKHLPGLVSHTSTKRVEFLPCEWRSHLKLDGDMVEAVTPHRLRGLRAVLNSSAMDFMYYTSPLYRSEIVRGLQSELNRLYRMFCDRNPGFEANDGKISIISHSLGSVITYDILTGWNPIHLYDQYLCHEQSSHPDLDEVDAEHEELAQELRIQRQRVEELESKLLSTNQVAAVARMPSLNFKVENLFCLGSPLAVFLSMRGVRPHGKGKQDVILPKSQCKRLFNIYHPADPVAYRIEPLLIKHYSTIMPLKINSSDSGKQKRYTEMTMMAYPSAKDKPKEMQAAKGSQFEMVDMKEMSTVELEKKPNKTGFWSKWTKKTECVETNPELQVFESMKEIAAKDEKETKKKKVPTATLR